MSRPLETGFSCSHWSNAMTTLRPSWRSTVSCSPPESASFAGQAAFSHSLVYQNTPKRLLDRFPSQRPQVSPPVGKPEWPAATVNRSTVRLWGVVAIRSRPTVPSTRTPLAQSAAAPCEAGTAGPAPHRVVPGSQPTQCNTLGLARGSGPFEPPTGGTPPCPPSSPPLPSPSPMTEASMAPEATAAGVMRPFGEAFDHSGEGSAL